ncbi:MAG: cobyrinate a,c-diamide synthase [Peptococcaceae bacterium]
MFPRIVIAGVQSGVGKTTIATGLMAAMAEKGYRVQGFKAGPDYIDPGYHTAATGNVSRNLDCWMLPEVYIKELFLRAAKGADLSVIEGVMGLYDGYSSRTEAGSTARLAKLLAAPVILVVDAKGMARSAAALVLGYKDFDPALNLSGIIFNHVGSEKHYQTLCEAVAEKTGLKALGYLPKNAALKMPERHLGLLPANERKELTAYLNKLAQVMAEFLDLEEILSVAKSAPPLDYPERSIFPAVKPKKVRIAVARDAAFNFYYQDALDLLAAWGAELVYFSPLADSSLPQNIQGVYLGGGFPEMFLEPLARNYSMAESIRRAHKKNMPIYAECGGLMYLSEGIIDFAGSFYPMVGLVPGKALMQKKLAVLGYMTAEVANDNILAKKGDVLRGHQFHWSTLVDVSGEVNCAYKLSCEGNPDSQKEGIITGNLLASYLHLHFAAHPRLARNFVDSGLKFAAQNINC